MTTTDFRPGHDASRDATDPGQGHTGSKVATNPAPGHGGGRKATDAGPGHAGGLAPTDPGAGSIGGRETTDPEPGGGRETTDPEPGGGRRGAALAELGASFRLALPVVGVQLGMLMMGLVDTAMLGHLSARALASASIAHIISFTLLIFGAGTLSALDPLISQAFGAGDRAAVGAHLRRGLALAVALTLPLSLLMIDLGPLLRALDEPSGVAADATLYARLLIFGNLPFLLFYVLRQTLQAMSVVRPSLQAAVAANLVNGLANYALIFGHWGCPRLGVAGSACATAAARWMMFLWLLVAARRTLRENARVPRGTAVFAGGWRRLVQLLRIGLPVGLQLAIELLLFVAIALLMGRFGTEAIAGHQVALLLCSLSFQLPAGIGGAAMTRVGNAIGRGDQAAARRTAAAGLALGTGVMSLFAAAFALAPRPLAELFTADPLVIAAAARLLPIAAAFQVFDGAQAVAAGILRGAADTALLAAGALLGYGLLGLPIGCLLAFNGGMGPRGLWWGATIGLGVVAVLLVSRIVYRFRRGIVRVE
ncbi:MAG TPA: MATE family efflux transporter [Thermoanaerobaculia bacterium]|nr:MATE family efflux transporter [Thermoanaerobaculia bacterium]